MSTSKLLETSRHFTEREAWGSDVFRHLKNDSQLSRHINKKSNWRDKVSQRLIIQFVIWTLELRPTTQRRYIPDQRTASTDFVSGPFSVSNLDCRQLYPLELYTYFWAAWLLTYTWIKFEELGVLCTSLTTSLHGCCTAQSTLGAVYLLISIVVAVRLCNYSTTYNILPRVRYMLSLAGR